MVWSVGGLRDLALKYLPFLAGPMANYFSDPVFRAALSKSPEEDMASALLHFAGVFADLSLTWEDLAQLRDMTGCPSSSRDSRAPTMPGPPSTKGSTG